MSNPGKSQTQPQPQANGDYQSLLNLLNSIGQGLITLDNLGAITLCNSAAQKMFGASSLEGKKLVDSLEVVDKDGSTVNLQKEVLNSGAGFSRQDWRLRNKDGSSINLQISVSPITPKEGTSGTEFVVLLRDITKDIKAEQERKDLLDLASRELVTPVSVAESSIKNAVLLAERGNAPQPIKSSLSAAYEQITSLSGLVNDLAVLAEADKDTAVKDVETFSAGKLVDALVRHYSASAGQKKLNLQSQVSERLGLLTTNQLYVREILQNFMTNSIKYTERGFITISAQPKDDGVEFSVSDTGIGISKEEQQGFFGQFIRGDDWRVQQNKGNGLGLYIAFKLSSLINAKIEIQSELNKGTQFRLLVPNLDIAG